MSSNWIVYLLNSDKRTYVGSTTDVKRRLRQHNGEIRGGARATKGHHWYISAYVSGFQNRSEACRWERIVKCRARGLILRYQALHDVSRGKCPTTHRNNREYPVPTGLTFRTLEWWEHG